MNKQRESIVIRSRRQQPAGAVENNVNLRELVNYRHPDPRARVEGRVWTAVHYATSGGMSLRDYCLVRK